MHTIKGVAATLGLKTLAEAASQAEAALVTPQTAEQQAALAEALRQATASALQAATYLNDALVQAAPLLDSPAPASAGSAADLRKALDELVGLLGAADMRAVDVFEQLQLAHAGPLHSALQPLGDAIAELDFDRALTLCKPFLSESLS